MPLVYIKCPRTGKPTPTGVRAKFGTDFSKSAAKGNKSKCQHCGQFHIWDGKDCFFIEESFIKENQATKSQGPDQLTELKKFVEDVLGNHFNPLTKRSLRAIHHKDSSYIPHRLIYLYERMLISEHGMNETPPNPDFISICELDFLKSIANRWQGTKEWDEIKHELLQREAYVHCLILLAWLTISTDTGMNVEIIPKDKETGVRTADAKIFNPFGEYMLAELKAPQVLLNPTHILTADEAYKIIRNARKKTGSGANRQIGNQPSALIIGGLFISDPNLDTLENAVKENFRRVPASNIAVCFIFSFSIIINNPVFKNGQQAIDINKTVISGVITQRVIVNKSYSGNLPIKFKEDTPLATIDESKRTQHTINGSGTGFNNVHEELLKRLANP